MENNSKEIIGTLGVYNTERNIRVSAIVTSELMKEIPGIKPALFGDEKDVEMFNNRITEVLKDILNKMAMVEDEKEPRSVSFKGGNQIK